MSLTVKAYLKRGENANAEIRRFMLDEGVTTNYEYVSKKVAQVFPSLGSPDNFLLSWKDSEGDFIAFSSDDELIEALGQLQEDIFRIYVKEKKKGRQGGNGHGNGPCNGARGAEEEVYHPGVICDGCENNIRGPRFKCMVCPDYDLCKNCEERGLHPDHTFVKFRKPQVGRTHNGGFFNRPGMFRQFGHPGWRRWWFWNQQQQQQQQQEQQQGQGQQEGGAATDQGQAQGGAPPTGPGPQGEGGCPMWAPPQHFLRDIGEQVAQMLDPLGIDVDVDVEHHGQRSHCAGEPRHCGSGGHGKHGRRHGRGRHGCRGPYGPWNTPGERVGSKNEGDKQQDQQKEKKGEKKPQQTTAPPANGATEKPAAEPMEMGDADGAGTSKGSGSGAAGSGSSAAGPDEADWTMVENGSPAPSGQNSGTSGQNAEPSGATNCQYPDALRQMIGMGFDNEGEWLSRLLEAKGGDIGRVLDAIKVGKLPNYEVA